MATNASTSTHIRRYLMDSKPVVMNPRSGNITEGKPRAPNRSMYYAMGYEDLLEIERRAIPGPGSCGGMYTANTMSSAFEALGMSLL